MTIIHQVAVGNVDLAQLPDDLNGKEAGDVVNLTPAQYARLSSTAISSGAVIDQGQTYADSRSGFTVWTHAVDLVDVEDGVVASFTPDFDGEITVLRVTTVDPVVTAADASDLSLEIEEVATTGGLAATTSANLNRVGATVVATAISAANEFSAGEKIDLVADSTVDYAEGSVLVEVFLTPA